MVNSITSLHVSGTGLPVPFVPLLVQAAKEAGRAEGSIRLEGIEYPEEIVW